MVAIIAALCAFILVVAFGWARHEMPNSGNVLLFALGGMIVIGGCVGFLVSALANIILRAGSPKLRLSMTCMAWLGIAASSYPWLLRSGGDPERSLILAAIAGAYGLLVGPYLAELFVGAWFIKRRMKIAETESARRRVEIERESARRQEEIRRQFQASQDARLNEEERRKAIRSYFRS